MELCRMFSVFQHKLENAISPGWLIHLQAQEFGGTDLRKGSWSGVELVPAS